MSIFTEIKEHITARQAAEFYGLKVSPKGMACCPFHEDNHPSLKIDTGFFCFGCGARGSDATGYVARLFGLSQIDAARKLITDFHLPINADYRNPEEMKRARALWKKREEEKRKSVREHLKFSKWCGKQIDQLRNAMRLAESIHEKFHAVGKPEEEMPEEVAEAVCAIPKMDYWLDILCLGEDEERYQLFLVSRNDLKDTVKTVMDAGRSYLGEAFGELYKTSLVMLPGSRTQMMNPSDIASGKVEKGKSAAYEYVR